MNANNMTNEDKAKQLYHEYEDATCCGVPMARGSVAFNAAMEMAQWKDEHPRKGLVNVEDVYKFIDDNFTATEYGNIICKVYGGFNPIEKLKDVFRKTIVNED